VIGTYQGVSHKVADIYVNVQLSRSLAYWAAWAVSEADPQQDVAVAAAKAAAAEGAVRACESAIQVHGGIGFTWEHVLHRYYKRAQWLEAFEGYGRVHRATVAAAILDGDDTEVAA
jgi:alkylation response protein AidB-like acyl-CoA dehydrogenase